VLIPGHTYISKIIMAPAIPKDSLVLVTGVNGWLGSHVADQFLQAGYRVRGTTRDLKKAEALKEFWEKQYGPDKLELVVVKDMSHDGAFDEAVKGTYSSFSHPAMHI
jgi:nucleoside-diphosphate-sugar epimerase